MSGKNDDVGFLQQYLLDYFQPDDFLTNLHSGMFFLRFCFVVKNVGRQDDFVNF